MPTPPPPKSQDDPPPETGGAAEPEAIDWEALSGKPAMPKGVKPPPKSWDPDADWQTLSSTSDKAAVQTAIDHGDLRIEWRMPRLVVILAMIIIQVPSFLGTLMFAMFIWSFISSVASQIPVRSTERSAWPWPWPLVVLNVFTPVLLPILCLVAFYRAWMHLSDRRYKLAILYSSLPGAILLLVVVIAIVYMKITR